MMKKLSMLVVLLVVIFVILRFVAFAPFYVVGNVMEPTFSEGSAVVVSKIGEKIRRNDIVVIKGEEGDFLVRRVIGMPKEEVEIEDAIVYIEGVEKNESAYTKGALPLDESYGFALKNDEYLVLSDNRDTVDLRSASTIKKKDIAGVYSPGATGWFNKIFRK